METSKVKHALVKREYLLPFILVTSLFFLWGFAHAILDVLNKHFQEELEITRTHSAMIQVMFYLGYFLMAIPAGLFITRHGYRRGVVVGLLLYAAGSLMFLPGEYFLSFNFFLFSLFVIACGLVFLETAANPYMTELGDKETAASRLNLAQSFNGLGCICGPLLGGMLLFSEGNEDASISQPYVLMGIVVLIVAFIFTRVNLPEIKYEEETASAHSAATVKDLWTNPLFVFGVIALFSYEISEISINSFFINYAVESHWLNAHDAAIVLSVAGLGLFMAGRFIGSWVMKSVRAEKALLFCGIGTVLTCSLVVANLGFLSRAGLILIYVFEAIMFPTIFSIALRGLGNLTKRASSFLMMTPVGGVVGPLLMGYVADHTDMALSFLIPLAGYLVVMAYSWKMIRVYSK